MLPRGEADPAEQPTGSAAHAGDGARMPDEGSTAGARPAPPSVGKLETTSLEDAQRELQALLDAIIRGD